MARKKRKHSGGLQTTAAAKKKLSFVGDQVAKEVSMLKAVPHAPRQSFSDVTPPKNKSTLTQKRRIDDMFGGMMVPPTGAYGLDVPVTRRYDNNLYGAYAEYYALLDEMYESDEVLRMCLDLIVSYMLMRPQYVKGEGEDADEDKTGEIIDFFNKYVVDNNSLNFRYMLWALAMGVLVHGRSTVEIQWGVVDGFFLPVKFWHCAPTEFAYDANWNMFFADNQQKVPANKFIYAVNPSLYDNPNGKSELFPFRYKWMYKKRVLIAKLQYLENYGTPIIHGQIPKESAEMEETINNFIEALGMLDSNNAIVTSQGEEIDVYQRMAGGLGGADGVHESIIDRFDRYFVRALLGGELTTSVSETGARSLGEVHERTILNKILPFAHLLMSALNQHLFQPIREFNFGKESPNVVYWIDTEESEDARDARDTLDCAIRNGVPVTVRQAQDMLGIEPPIGDETILKPIAVKGAGTVIDRVLSGQGLDDSQVDEAEDIIEDIEDDIDEAEEDAEKKSSDEPLVAMQDQSYGCVMLPLSDSIKKKAIAFVEDKIAADDLIEAVTDTHITLLYGLHDSVTLSDVKDKVMGEWPVWTSLDELKVFQNDDADVLYISVPWMSENAHTMRNSLLELPHTLTRNEYTPHVTLAYLKPGTGEKYAEEFKYEFEFYDDYLPFVRFTDASDTVDELVALVGDYVEMDGFHPTRLYNIKKKLSFVRTRPDGKKLKHVFDSMDSRYAKLCFDLSKDLEAQGVEWRDAIELASINDTLPMVHASFDATVKNFQAKAELIDGDSPLTSDFELVIDTAPLKPELSIQRFTLSCYMVRMFIQSGQLEHVVDRDDNSFRYAESDILDLLPPGFKDASEWMAARGVMTVPQVRSIAQIMVDQYGGELEAYERDLRSHYLALANTTHVGVTRQVQEVIARNIKQGVTVSNFVNEMTDMAEINKLPGATRNYWETVYRTEVSNAYTEAQVKFESRDDFEPYLWGWELFNPNDDRSDPTHAALDGLYFKKGSRASEVLGNPPFRYNCRCSKYALTMPDPENPDYDESRNALTVAGDVTRF